MRENGLKRPIQTSNIAEQQNFSYPFCFGSVPRSSAHLHGNQTERFQIEPLLQRSQKRTENSSELGQFQQFLCKRKAYPYQSYSGSIRNCSVWPSCKRGLNLTKLLYKRLSICQNTLSLYENLENKVAIEHVGRMG